MSKLKIIGIENSDDNLWLKVEGKIEVLQKLDDIFNLNELIPSGQINSKSSYTSWLKHNPKDFLIDTPNCIVYIILTPNIIHLIIRKTKKFDKIKSTIYDHFSFWFDI